MSLRLTQNLKLKGTLLVVLSGLLYGCIGVLGTSLYHQHISIITMLFWRFFAATLAVSLYLFFSKPQVFAFLKTKGQWLRILSFGAATYCSSSALYFLATTYIGTGLAMVIFFSFPVFVTLFSWCFSQWRMNRFSAIALGLVIAGLLCLPEQGAWGANFAGIGAAIGAGFCYALYIYSSKSYTSHLDTHLMTLVVCLGNTLFAFAGSLLTQSFVLPVTLEAWLAILALGVIATAIPILLLLQGMRYISPVQASILSVFEPVGTLVLGITLLHESMTALQLFGVFIILLGAILVQFEPVN